MIIYNLNSDETQEANSKAISLWAYVPPYLPALDTIPMALVDSIHYLGDSVKAFAPESFLTLSNAIGLKLGLYIFSQRPKYSILLLLLIQLLITIKGSSLFCLAISVKLI